MNCHFPLLLNITSGDNLREYPLLLPHFTVGETEIQGGERALPAYTVQIVADPLFDLIKKWSINIAWSKTLPRLLKA